MAPPACAHTDPEKILECVDELLNTPERWVRSEFAVGANGRPVPTKSPEAERFCLIGALDRCSGDHDPTAYAAARTILNRAVGRDVSEYERESGHGYIPIGVMNFNDDYRITFEHVRRVISIARELVKEAASDVPQAGG